MFLRRLFAVFLLVALGWFIWVYQQTDPDHYNVISKIPTVVGAGTAGYFGRQGKGFDRFYLAVSAGANTNAEVRIYTMQD